MRTRLPFFGRIVLLVAMLCMSNMLFAQQEDYEQDSYRYPRHRYSSYFGSDFSSHFLEFKSMYGREDIAFGFSYTYMGERWGAYGSAMWGIESNYFSAGPTYRFVDNTSNVDAQFYVGIIGFQHPGYELGIRFAENPKKPGGFSWISASVGVAQMQHATFFQMGLSIDILVLMGLLCL